MVAPNLTRYLRLSDLSLQEQTYPINKAYPALDPPGTLIAWRNVRPGADSRPARIHILRVPLKELVAATFSSRKDVLVNNKESAEILLNFRVPTEFPQLQLAPQVNQVVLSADPAPVAPTFSGFSITMVRDECQRIQVDGEWLCLYYRWNDTLRAIVRERFLWQDKNLEVL